MKEILQKYAALFGIELTDTQLEQFELYSSSLRQWNEKINLTAIVEPKQIAIKHFADSLSLLCSIDIPNGSSLIDVGTGAGFPGLALKIARPDLHVTLLDSTRKKLGVIENIANQLGVEAELIHARAEEINRQSDFAGQFDVVTARAVARLNKLAAWCLPFAKKNGIFASMKGADAKEEIKEAEIKIERLGGIIENVHTFELENAGQRANIIIRKTK